jgi:HlyD family secretion protein
MKRVVLVFIGLAVLAIFVGIPVYKVFFDKPEAAPPQALSPVAAGKATRGRIADSLFFPGILSPESTVAVVAKISGKILSVSAKEGQRVAEGELMARLEDTAPRLQAAQARAALDAALAQRSKAVKGVRPEELENAKATLEQAQQDLDKARSDFERTGKLYASGTVSKSAYEEAENRIRGATTQVDNARRMVQLMEKGATDEDLALAQANEGAMKAQYDLAMLQLGYALVRAPVSGTVARVMAKAGNMAGAGTPLFAIIQDKSVLAQMALPEKHYGRIAGTLREIKVLVKPIAFEGPERFQGVVTSVGQSIDPASRTFVVEAAIANQDRALRPGMYVNAELVLQTWDDALLLPAEAISSRGGREGVFVIYGEGPYHVRFAPIETGIERDGMVQVLSGLGETELVVFKGNSFLEDGQEVAYSPEAPAANPATGSSAFMATGVEGGRAATGVGGAE